MNTTIYKHLKVSGNKLKFKNDVLYAFEDNDSIDNYIIEDSIRKLKSTIPTYQKLYIKQCIEHKVEISDSIIIIKLKCKDDNYNIYRRNIELATFNKNQILFL